MGNAVVRVNGHAYESHGVVADGGFATVYRVTRDGTEFALKWTRGVANREQLQRILQEIQLHRQLQHPNATRLVEAEVRIANTNANTNTSPLKMTGATPISQYPTASASVKEVLLVFPFYRRGTLQQHIQDAFAQQKPAFTEAECLRIFVLVVEAVLEMQARGFAHRDIKPHNILLTSTEPVEPILTDFGSAAPVKTTVHSAHDAVQLFDEATQFTSAAYRAPELWAAHATTRFRGEIDGRTDVWALGCVLFAMAFGPYSPFEDPTQGVLPLAIFNGTVRLPASNTRFGQSFSSGFVALIRSILVVEPQDRPTIYQVLDKVDRLRTGRVSRRSLSLRRSVSGSNRSLPQTVTSQSTDDGWADFSALEAASEDASVASMSSVVSSQSSWRVVSRQSLSGPESVASSSSRSVRVLSVSCQESSDQLEERRKLSMQGRQLLAAALQI